MGSRKDEILNGGGVSGEGNVKPGKYEAMYRALNQEPSDEDYKRAERRGRREKLFASISDGISALSNLFFTSRYAPNIYNGENSLSGKARARYDRMKKDYKDSRIAYYTGLQKAQQADDAAARVDRDFKFNKERAEKADEKDERDFNYRKERDKKADERNDRDFNYRKERDGVKDDQWQKQFDEGKRQAREKNALGWANHRVARQRANTAAANKGGRPVSQIRGKSLAFSDGNGNQVAIYENVWKGSMQQVYDVLVEDMKAAREKDPANNPRVSRHKSAQEKDDFVKQNWHRSERARAMMLGLSRLDPVTMTSSLTYEDEDDYSEYAEGEDDYSEYIVN